MRLIIAIALQILALLSFLIWGFSALFAPMLFAGDDGAQTQAVFGLFMLMPISMVAASVAIWFGYAKRKPRITGVSALFIALSFLPLFWQ